MAEPVTSILAGKPQERRKLVAVVYADMVGYSRLIGLDDAGTLERLRTLRQNLIDPAIEAHGGKIAQTGGDSLLIVFDSIDGAVRCAVKVQQQVPDYDTDQPADRAIRFRIGINIGDAIADGTDMHGDAVNVAARLQAESPPGSICVSRSVRDHVRDRLSLAFEELGSLNLKNIARPVEAFVLRPNDVATPPKPIERPLVQGTDGALPLPGKPSIAVLAFTNMSGDPEQEYLSDGIADEIITELSRSRSLFVIARTSSFTYKGRAADIKQVARELGVRYVLEGSVRRSGGRVRVIAQLIDAETGGNVWAARYDRNLADVFAVQDEITAAVASAIAPVISHAERQRAIRKPPGNLSAWEAYQRGLWHLTTFRLTDIEQARGFFRRATELDPTFAQAFAKLAASHTLVLGAFGPPGSIRESMEMAAAEARRAIELDAEEPVALVALGWVSFCDADHDIARERAEQAISIDPNYASAYLLKGAALTFSGSQDDGRESALTALRLSPHDSSVPFALLVVSVACYFAGDYAGALGVAQRAVRDYPSYPSPHRYLAASLGQLGRIDGARVALQQAMAVSQEGFDFLVRSRPPWCRPSDHEHIRDGLRKAGWNG